MHARTHTHTHKETNSSELITSVLRKRHQHVSIYHECTADILRQKSLRVLIIAPGIVMLKFAGFLREKNATSAYLDKIIEGIAIGKGGLACQYS